MAMKWTCYCPERTSSGFVYADTLAFVDRKPPARTSKPFTNPEPAFDAGEVLKRIRTVQSQNLQRLNDDIAKLTKYLKTQDVPRAVIDALERLSGQKESWKKTLEQIEELLEE